MCCACPPHERGRDGRGVHFDGFPFYGFPFFGTAGRDQRATGEERSLTTRRPRISRMVKAWLVRLRLARDDGGPLSDEGIRELTDLLTKKRVFPVLTRVVSRQVVEIRHRHPRFSRDRSE